MRGPASKHLTVQRSSGCCATAPEPPFAMDRLRKVGAALVYRCAKQHSEPTNDKRGTKVDELHLTPMELIDRIAALMPPPRTHRHRYFGVLAPNSLLRAAVTALAAPAKVLPLPASPASCGTGEGVPIQPEPVPPKRSPLWDDCGDAQMDDGAQIEPADWDLAAQVAPDLEVDQRISW